MGLQHGAETSREYPPPGRTPDPSLTAPCTRRLEKPRSSNEHSLLVLLAGNTPWQRPCSRSTLQKSVEAFDMSVSWVQCFSCFEVCLPCRCSNVVGICVQRLASSRFSGQQTPGVKRGEFTALQSITLQGCELPFTIISIPLFLLFRRVPDEPCR